MSDDDAKAAFAAFLFANPLDKFGAARRVFANDDEIGKAAEIAAKWPNDEFVIAELARLRELNDSEAALPSKADLARMAWDMGSNKAAEYEDRIKALKLYADIRGFIEKPDNTPKDIGALPSVMVVREYASEADWEAKMQQQQDDLTNGKYVAKKSATH